MRQIQMMPIGEVHPYPGNPRKNDDAVDKVAESIRQFGWQQPIVVDKDNVIIVGHTRLKAAKRLHMEEVPVLVADNLTEEQAKAYRLADNRSGEFSEWDQDLLTEELLALKNLNYDITSIGFDDTDIELPDTNEEAVDDEYDPEIPDDPTTQPGDIWILGRHRLMCGDSCDEESVRRLMNGEQADLAITDPPYNVNYKEGSIKNDNMSSGAFLDFLTEAFGCMSMAMREGAAAYIFHADGGEAGYCFRKAFLDAGFKIAECLIWEKNAFVLGRQDYQWRHEPILYGWKEGAGHYFLNDRSQDTILGDDKPLDFTKMKKEELVDFCQKMMEEYKDKTTILYENKPTKNDLHPTMKPVPLIGRLIKNSSKKDWKILDLFGGSGSTLIAAEQLGRQAYLMELDQSFADVIVDRYITWNGSDEDVFLENKDGTRTPYSEVKAYKSRN